MAKNVSLLGADYPDVPAVLLPQTGGGTARFDDVSDTTAAAGDVLSGKKFHKADGSLETGSVGSASATITGSNTVTPSASLSGSNAQLSDINNGVSVTATGGGSASASATASTNAAGYAAGGATLGTGTLSASSTTTTATKYISGVILTAPSSGSRSFTVTVPNGNSTIIYIFNVDSSGNVTISV